MIVYAVMFPSGSRVTFETKEKAVEFMETYEEGLKLTEDFGTDDGHKES